MKTDVIINRDALCALRELPDESVHCCVTSPPYYALRDYGLDAQIGREDTPEQYIDRLVAVFHELKRVLRPDGTFWLNIADTYCGTGSKGGYYDDALIPTMRNKRDIWLINTVPYKGGHFAAFPPKLAETCILAGCPKGGVVIDPFFGSGTTGKAAKDLDRHYIGIEINIEYCALARARIGGEST